MIGSLEEYRAKEEEMKGLLARIGVSGDLYDQQRMSPENQALDEQIGALRKDLSAYRSAHPDEFTS